MKNLLAVEHGKTCGHYSPYYNPKETKRGIPNLEFKKHKIVITSKFSFK